MRGNQTKLSDMFTRQTVDLNDSNDNAEDFEGADAAAK